MKIVRFFLAALFAGILFSCENFQSPTAPLAEDSSSAVSTNRGIKRHAIKKFPVYACPNCVVRFVSSDPVCGNPVNNFRGGIFRYYVENTSPYPATLAIILYSPDWSAIESSGSGHVIDPGFRGEVEINEVKASQRPVVAGGACVELESLGTPENDFQTKLLARSCFYCEHEFK